MAEPVPTNDGRQWDDHWTRYAAATRLNPGQVFRRRLISRRLADAGDGAILDVGCGAGDLLAGLKTVYPGARLAGIDQSSSGLEIAKALLPEGIFEAHDFAAAQAPPERLEAWASHAVCSEVLEHVDDPVRTLANVRAFLAPGGRLIVTVPGGPMSAFDRQIGHRGHYTAARLRSELDAAGYDVEAATGAGFPFFNVYRLVVILRGEQLAKDIERSPGLLARAVMAVFRGLTRFTIPWLPWGWQIVAVARCRKPGESAA